MEGRHVHPSTLYPGGVGTVATIQLFTDYLVRLMRYVEFMKKVVPLHDDLFDFFYEALPGYEEVGRRARPARLLGLVQGPETLRLHLRHMTRLGPQDVRHPGVVVDGELVTTDLVDINLGIRILLGSSFYDDWEDQETFVKQTRWATRSTSGTRGTRHDPAAAEARLRRQVHLGDVAALVRQAPTTWRSTPAAARSPGCGRPRWPAWSTSATSRPPGTA